MVAFWFSERVIQWFLFYLVVFVKNILISEKIKSLLRSCVVTYRHYGASLYRLPVFYFKKSTSFMCSECVKNIHDKIFSIVKFVRNLAERHFLKIVWTNGLGFSSFNLACDVVLLGSGTSYLCINESTLLYSCIDSDISLVISMKLYVRFAESNSISPTAKFFYSSFSSSIISLFC